MHFDLLSGFNRRVIENTISKKLYCLSLMWMTNSKLLCPKRYDQTEEWKQSRHLQLTKVFMLSTISAIHKNVGNMGGLYTIKRLNVFGRIFSIMGVILAVTFPRA